jgi:hypothetical protein
MKRVVVFIAIITLVLAGCCVACLRSAELAYRVAGVLPAPIVERLTPAYEKARELLQTVEGAGGTGAENSTDSDGGERADRWSLPSLDVIDFGAGKLKSIDDIHLEAIDDYGQNYVFYYGGEQFEAYFDSQSWKVYDSYRITNHADIAIICQALLNEHVVYGSDWVTPRTADDMAYEWEQHNLAYKILPAGNHWRNDAKDVDLDPYDQGLSFEEMYERRTGEKFDLGRYLPGA